MPRQEDIAGENFEVIISTVSAYGVVVFGVLLLLLLFPHDEEDEDCPTLPLVVEEDLVFLLPHPPVVSTFCPLI